MNMIINGQDLPASDGETINVINPYNNEWIDSVPSATKEDIDTAVKAARSAWRSWKKTPVYKRVDLVNNFLTLVDQNRTGLGRLLSLESGKTITETAVEMNNIFTAWHAFSEKAKHLYDTVIPAGLEYNHDNNIVLTKREPLGVVACIIPFNFPCNLFNQKVAPAILAGNCVIVKPATDNPLTICRLVSLMREAGFPDGVVQVVTGRGSTIGEYLSTHKGIDAITLTGSTTVGMEVAEKAAPSLKRIALELGGNDAFIVLEDADLDLAINEAVNARFFNAGQICCAPKRFLIHRSYYETFVTAVTERIAAFSFGDPLNPDTKVGTVISERAARIVEDQIQLTVQQGGRIVLGGSREGAFVAPTVIRDVPFSADVMHDMEIFGPVMPIAAFDSEDEALELANATIYGLGGSVFTRDMKKAMKFTDNLECGSVVINGSSSFRSFEMPFGGFKYSGIGSEGVFSTFDELTQLKCITLKGIGNY